MCLKMLMWKDFRQQGRFLRDSFVLLSAPYVILAIVFAVRQLGGQTRESWFEFIMAGAWGDLFIGILLFGCYPANAIAGERADGTADFFAYLPIRRMDAVISKAVVSLALSTAVLGTCVALMYLCVPVNSREPGPSWDDSSVFFATLVATFGVSWMVSSFTNSTSFAVVTGIGGPIGVGLTLAWFLERQGVTETQIGSYYGVLCLVLGAGSFTLGVWYYLRRVGP